MMLLRIENLYRSFGSLVVTNNVNLAIEPGERHAIIGPNGAGKTSLVNQIGGQLAPSDGRIWLKGNDITGWPPDRVSRAGVARTFQRNNLFQNLGVLENLRLAVQARRGRSLDFFTPVRRLSLLTARAEELMRQVELRQDGTAPARNLSYGEQRQLELGIALAGEPDLLLLDEPTSGMSPAETARVLSVSLSKVYDLMRKGELSSYRDGRSRRVLMSSIHEYVARRVADTDNGGWQTWEHNPQARRGRQVKEHE